ncbi:MAG: TraC family protein [Candidatus Andersenbacteria bacterium]
MKSKEKKGKPAQDLVRISEIREGVVILSDAGMRAILLVSSVNFALKSEDEQNAIIYAYQEFINSLDFPIQISISSRKMDITPYLEEVKHKRDTQKNELLRLQMNEYIDFVGGLVENSNIMSKTFFVTISFSVVQNKKENFLGRIFKGVKSATGKHTFNDQEFEHARNQLFQRVEQVAVGLRGIGLRVVPLQTQELLELFYNMYNPSTSRNQRLRGLGELHIQETSSS